MIAPFPVLPQVKLLSFLGRLVSTCFRVLLNPHGWSWLTVRHSGIFGPVRTGREYAITFFFVFLFFASLSRRSLSGPEFRKRSRFERHPVFPTEEVRAPWSLRVPPRLVPFRAGASIGTSIVGVSEKQALSGPVFSVSRATSRLTVVQVPV